MGLVAPDLDRVVRPGTVLGLPDQQVGDIGLLPTGVDPAMIPKNG